MNNKENYDKKKNMLGLLVDRFNKEEKLDTFKGMKDEFASRNMMPLYDRKKVIELVYDTCNGEINKFK